MKTFKIKYYPLFNKRFDVKALSFLSFGFHLLTISLFGQTPNSTENYIMSTEYLDSIGDRGQKKVNIMYFDGLGREKQAISHKATPDAKDIVVHYEYDEFGRQFKDFLPAPTNQSSGQIITDPTTTVYDPYYDEEYENEEGIYFSQKKLEESVLGRPLEQSAPGKDWKPESGHEIEFDYSFNSTADDVRLFKADAEWGTSELIYYDVTLIEREKPFDENELYRIRTTDENGNATIQFTNKFGQMVLQRKFVTPDTSAGRSGNPNPSQIVEVNTYYVYDQYGNLAFVIPPLAESKGTITQTILDELCYQYKYDKRNRLAERKLPGKGWEFMVYDLQDRLVATQDAEMRKSTFAFPSGKTGQAWAFTKYDVYGRVVYTGLYKSSSARKSIQTLVDGYGTNNELRQSSSFSQNGVTVYYSKANAFPKNHSASDSDLLTVNFYDTSYANILAAGVSIPAQVGDVYHKIKQGTSTSKNQSLKGLPIASYTRVIPGNDWEKTYTFYDRRSQPLVTHKVNHLGGYTRTETFPDFRGKPKTSHTYHARTDTVAETEIEDTFTYDPQERPLTQARKIDNAATAERIFSNTYNELGQLVEKGVGNSVTLSPLQNVQYAYNIRGWLTDINDVNNLVLSGDPVDLFSFKINYNNAVQSHFGSGSGIEPLYNGNIAETLWRTVSDNVLRGYGYRYDQMNRLRDAVYQKPGATVPTPGNYDELAAYDLNGNILSLHRYSAPSDSSIAQFTDELQYTYAAYSNKLKKVDDASNSDTGFKDGTNTADDYTYDANANMTSDQNKGITSITYNHLNLPVKIQKSSTEKIEYLYDAAGIKVQKKVTDGTTIKTTEYLDGFQYEDNLLEFFPTSEGYVKATPMSPNPADPQYSYNYVYNYTDHLGNVRISYAKDPQTGDLKVMEENNYYPYGLKHAGYASAVSLSFQKQLDDWGVILAPVTNNPYKYKYNGKELQDELGLNMYGMDMRQYDPAIARWVVLDPVIHYSMSPYNAFDNNPVFWADPSGADGESSDSGSGVMAMGIPIETVMSCSANTFTSFADSYETTKTRTSTMTVGEDNPESLQNLPEGETVPEETRDYLSGASVRTYTSTTTTYHEGGADWMGSSIDVYTNWEGAFATKAYKTSVITTALSAQLDGNTRIVNQMEGLSKSNGYSKLVGKVGVGVSIGVGIYNSYQGYKLDGNTVGYNTQRAVVSGSLGIAGGWAGAEAGAMIGAGIGAWFGGVGAVPGAIIGGFIGGVAGSMAGEATGEAIIDSAYGK